jgi:hypothetical protein
MAAKHYMRNRRAEAMLGFALFGLGALLLRDSYDRRGVDQPAFMRPFSFW